MEDDALLPLGSTTASDIRELKQPGFVLPVRDNDPRMLITLWGSDMHAVILTGDNAFLSFPITLRSPHTGLFFPQAEILVDFSTPTDVRNANEERGLLILTQDSLSVVATQAGDHFSDPRPVPLWQTVEGGSAEAKVAFSHWGVGIRRGDGFHILWERETPTQSFYENA